MKTNNSAIVSACEGEGEVVEFEEGEAANVAESIRTLIASAPDHIWLDLGENLEALNDDATFRDLREVTWSEDNATGVGIKYVRAAALPAGDVGAGWQPISTAPHTRKVLVTYLNRIGKRRTVMACYYEEGELPMSDSYQGDEEFAEPGWYEECETADETIYPVEGAPTHWHELPPSPIATLPSQAEGQEVRG